MGLNQVVVFSLGMEEYGIDISCAKEIIRIPKQITKIPDMPSYVEGMFNLRGKVIPVIDLKKKYNFKCVERSGDGRLIILDVEGILMGIIIDEVSEVLETDEELIESLNSQIFNLGRKSIMGICKIEERLILILDIVKLKNDIFKTGEHEMEEAI
jgi:purine-binding chemotaxis protein CheW